MDVSVTASPPITLHEASVNGLRIHYASCGVPGRPLVVFLHGFPEFWFAWEAQLRALGTDYYAIAPDLRGYNLSEKPSALREYRAPRAAADVPALAASLGYKDFALVGHDWGASVAYTVAIGWPQQVRRLVIVNGVHPAVFVRELAESAEQRAASEYINLFREPDAACRLAADGCAYLLGMFEEHGQLPRWFDASLRARYLQAWAQPGAIEGGLNYYRASPLHPSGQGIASSLQIDADALRVHAPTLLIWGERDRYLLPGCAHGLEPYVPKLRTERFPHASHWIVHEEPEAVSRLVRQHIES